ncbi:hypothetical protein GOP47_0014214 [Adiantum capillus-veneris]|uniref:Uncharacterized protein n=1 Tax=Adiantum capillus-veneris TaxID=13818 RepID=A0A9D4ZDZ0_ADICA|nr:hypothetical protein GOP47_0014214 [Adiantum capillus-veneris]
MHTHIVTTLLTLTVPPTSTPPTQLRVHPAIMSAAAEEPTAAGPSPASISCSPKTSSSFCSFDVRIWEELHLQSLLSSSINDAHADTSGAGQLWKAEKVKEPKCQSHSQGFSFFSSSSARGASFSGFSSPHRLSNASSQSGLPLLPSSSRRDSTLLVNSPLHYKVEEPPVVQVIQTGSMSFTSDELVIRQTPMCSGDAGLPVENHMLAECKANIPSPELEEFSSNCHANRSENSILLGTLSNAKFLQISAPDVYSAPISPLKSAGSIPFKWEEMPGKPKSNTDHRQLSKPSTPSLQLPPKLLYSSLPSSNCSSPYSRSRSKHIIGSSSPSSGDGIISKSGSVKSLWQSFMQSGRRSYREGGGRSLSKGLLSSDDDPSSPTSTLIGPDAGLSSSSSTSSTLDAMCASPGRIPEVQSTVGRVWASSLDDVASSSQMTALMPTLSSSSLCEASAYIGNGLPNLAPSMERKIEKTVRCKATDKLKGLLKSYQRWKGLGAHRKRNHEEAEMWEPTLATYFHSMELERTSGMSGQPFLHEKRASSENCRDEGYLAPAAIVASCSSVETESYNACMKGSAHHDVLKEDVMIFFGKPTCIEKSSMGMKGKNAKVRRKGGGWVLRKLKKSSKVLDALLRAISRSTTRGGESNKKCKRRRLPYQPIAC